MGDFTAEELTLSDELRLDIEDLLDLKPEGADDLDAAVPEDPLVAAGAVATIRTPPAASRPANPSGPQSPLPGRRHYADDPHPQCLA